jgi:hypothetical protein
MWPSCGLRGSLLPRSSCCFFTTEPRRRADAEASPLSSRVLVRPVIGVPLQPADSRMIARCCALVLDTGASKSAPDRYRFRFWAWREHDCRLVLEPPVAPDTRIEMDVDIVLGLHRFPEVVRSLGARKRGRLRRSGPSGV